MYDKESQKTHTHTHTRDTPHIMCVCVGHNNWHSKRVWLPSWYVNYYLNEYIIYIHIIRQYPLHGAALQKANFLWSQ